MMALVTINNGTTTPACVATAAWELAPLPHWHGSGWQCLSPGETRGFPFETSLLVTVSINGYGTTGSDYVATHPYSGFAPTQEEWVRPGPFEARIAPLPGGAYAAEVSVAGGPWQTRQAQSREDLLHQLQGLGFGPAAAWRLDQSFCVTLTSP